MRGISGIAEKQSASQEGLGFMALVKWLYLAALIVSSSLF
jgi:hypothetical protein